MKWNSLTDKYETIEFVFIRFPGTRSGLIKQLVNGLHNNSALFSYYRDHALPR